MSGAVAFHSGMAAEESVARRYLAEGMDERARRWRGPGGEIDLILGDGERLIFVEVKKARDFAAAAARVTQRQQRRIYASAGAYLADMPKGQDTEARFDVALVDCNGEVEILENAFGL